jgi:CBS domain containing-hemolysin-like protein
MIVFAKLARPLIMLMNGTGTFILRLLGYRTPTGEAMVHSVEELSLLIEDTEEAGILDPEQADLVVNVFRLSNKRVRDCMVPRDKVGALELSMPPDKVLEAARRGAHTRMPVYEGELDNVVGIVNTKDLFYLFSQRGLVILEDALYPALFLKPDETVATPSASSARRTGPWHWSATTRAGFTGWSRWRTSWRRSSATSRTSTTGRRPR